MLQMIIGGGLSLPELLFVMFSYAAIVLVMLPVHEMAHAFTADRLGDTTPRWNGRLTLNPFAHLDILGTVMIVLFGIGYAKPVPVNSRNFKNPRIGMVLTALAGPVSNLLMAILSVGLFRLVLLIGGLDIYVIGGSIYYSGTNAVLLQYAYLVLIQVFATVNIGLAVFNLLPIPPLDGSRILWLFLPPRALYRLEQYGRFIVIGVLVLLYTGILDVPLALLRHGVGFLICGMFGLPNLL